MVLFCRQNIFVHDKIPTLVFMNFSLEVSRAAFFSTLNCINRQNTQLTGFIHRQYCIANAVHKHQIITNFTFSRRSCAALCHKKMATPKLLRNRMHSHRKFKIFNKWIKQGDHSSDNEIPWRFAALLRSTQHIRCYWYHARTSVTVSGGGRNAIVHDPKPYLICNTK